MNSFFEDSLKPEVFWAALAALGTTAAVLVALFQPLISNVRLNKRIRNLIESEMTRNYAIIRQMVSDTTVTLGEKHIISPHQRDAALATLIKLNLWDTYRYKLASDDPDLAIVAKKESKSKAPSEKQRGVTERASQKDVPQRAANDQDMTAAQVADSATEGGPRTRKTAKTVTSNLLKNLEDLVETARIAARQPAAIELKDPVPAQTNDLATVNIAANDATATVSPIRATPAVPPPNDLPTVATARSSPPVRKTIPVPITFVYNESTLTEDGRKAAALLFEYLQIKKFPKVSLTGHADERGTDELNMALSRERLATVKRFLRVSGFEGELELVPKGESEPFAGVERGEYEREDLYQLDRRVELIITR